MIFPGARASRRRSSAVASRRGFALPLAILALIAVGLVLTTGIHLALRSDAGGVTAEQATEAFYLAETGLNTVLAEWRPAAEGLRVWGEPEMRMGSTGQGHWEAEVQRVGERLFFVRSTGVAEGGPGAPSARRSIGIAARMEPVDWWVAGGLHVDGAVETMGGARIASQDEDPPGWTQALCAGSHDPAGGEGGENTEIRAAGRFEGGELARAADLDLPGELVEDVGPVGGADACERENVLNWGDPLDPDAPCGDYFPVVRLVGDTHIRGSGVGQGTLVVEGDLTIEGPFAFYGNVVVRGLLTLRESGSGSPAIYGAVLVENVDEGVVRVSGASLVQNSHCAVGRAILGNDRLRRIRPLPTRSWVDLAGASL